MYVRFSKNIEPCLAYKVINPTPIYDYCEVQKRWCELIEIEVLGMVPLDLLTETNNPENHSPIEVAIFLTNKVEETLKDKDY